MFDSTICRHGDYIEDGSGVNPTICSELLADDAWIAERTQRVVVIASETRDQLEDLLTRVSMVGPTDLRTQLDNKREAAALLSIVRDTRRLA